MRVSTLYLILSSGVVIMLSSCSTPAAHETDASPAAANPKRPVPLSMETNADKILRLTLRITDTGVETLSTVEADGAPNRRDRHAQSSTFFRVMTKDNRVLFTRGFRMPGARRAEFPDENGRLSRFRGAEAPAVISIIVPVFLDAHKLQLLRYKNAAAQTQSLAADTHSSQTIELIGEVPL